MTRCERMEPHLSALMDGELDAATERAVCAHVDGCAPCSASLDRLRAVGAVLRRWDAEETRYAATNAFRSRVVGQVGGQAGGRLVADASGARSGVRPAGTRAARTAAPSLLLTRVAAAAVLVLAVGSAGYVAWDRAAADDTADLVAAVEARLLARLAEERETATPLIPMREAAPFDIQRVRPLGTVVTPSEDTTSAANASAGGSSAEDASARHGSARRGTDAGGSAAVARSDQWEEHGDARILRDVFPLHDRFQREQRDAALLEEFRRLQARAAAPPDERRTTDVVTVTVLGRYLGELEVAAGSFAPFEQVQVWPVVRPSAVTARASEREVITADEALDLQILRVREGSRDGDDEGTLIVENRDRRGRNVLLLAGDVVSGARRDRIVAEDVLLEPSQSRSVRALATGDARRAARRTFSRSDGLAPQRVRALLARGGEQAAVDAQIADCLPWLGSAGGQGSVNAVFGNDQLLSRADRYLRAFRSRLDAPEVVGFAFAAGEELLGIEVFDDHATFATARSRVLRSYVLEALARPRLVGEPPARLAAETALAAGSRAANSGTGGELSAFVDPTALLTGYGLVMPEGVRHAVIFSGDVVAPVATAASGPGAGLAPTPGLGEGAGGAGTAPMRGDQPTGGGLGPADSR